ncbi:MAG: hypothetical protein PWQ37_2887 [Candidatus Petromonas sp.]|jgi:transcriptional regulator with XRE-family HTH domain|nr:hypothetical protein [Candidatus Petromonas sp.]
MNFGKRLSQLRKENQMTQSELAKKLEISRGTIGMYEIGKRDPDTKTLEKISDIFNVSTDYLLGRTDVRNLQEDEIELTNEEQQLLEKIKSDPELSILFHDLKSAPKKKIKQLLKTWEFVKEQFDNWDDEE